MSGRGSADGPETDREEAWEPTYPWERVGAWLGGTERGRFVGFNALLYPLIGVAFALRSGVQAVGRDATRSVVAINPPPGPGEAVVLAVRYTLSLTPVLAAGSGILAGLLIGDATLERAVAGAAGVTAGVVALLVVLFATAGILGVGLAGALGGTAGPVTSGIVAVLVGGGAAVLTDRLLPGRRDR